MEKNSNRQDNVQNNSEDMQISKHLEAGRGETSYNPQRMQAYENQQHIIQEEWHTQRRRNNTQ